MESIKVLLSCVEKKSFQKGRSFPHLPFDGTANLSVAHPHLLHHLEILLVLKPFCDLFIVHNNQQADQENSTVENADNFETLEYTVKREMQESRLVTKQPDNTFGNMVLVVFATPINSSPPYILSTSFICSRRSSYVANPACLDTYFSSCAEKLSTASSWPWGWKPYI